MRDGVVLLKQEIRIAGKSHLVSDGYQRMGRYRRVMGTNFPLLLLSSFFLFSTVLSDLRFDNVERFGSGANAGKGFFLRY